MPTYSSIEIEFLEDLAIDSTIKILRAIDNIGQGAETWTFVATRSAGFEVTTGTPTATAGEVTAQNFETAFDLDKATGFVTTQTTNTVLIESETLGEDFVGFKMEDENGVPLVNGTDYNVTFDNYVIPLDLTTVGRMLSRSPYYINTPFFFNTTTDVTIEIKIYYGDFITDEPATPTYTLTKIRPTIDYEEFNTNIGRVVNDFLQSNINTTLEILDVQESTNECAWVKYTATYTDPSEELAVLSGYFIASDGYGEFLDGVNPNFEGVLTTCRNRKVDRANGYVIVPFVNDTTFNNVTVVSSPSNEIIDSFALTTTTDTTNSFIEYVNADVSQTTSDTSITVTFTYTAGGTEVFTYDIVDECRYTPKTIIFKNKYGFYDVVTMFAKSKEDLNVERDMFVNNYVDAGTYSTTKHQYQTINVIGKKSIVCSSGYIKESENTLYEEMMLSEQVWFYESGSFIPIKPQTSQFTYKTRINDSLVDYQITFDYAYNLINNI